MDINILHIFFLSIITTVLLFSAVYDFRYHEVFNIVPLVIITCSLLDLFVLNADTVMLTQAFISGFFLFLVGIMLYISSSTGWGDALMFLAMGFALKNMFFSTLFLGFTVVFFLPFLILFLIKYWKTKGYDITWNGFIKQIPVKDLKEGMVLSQTKKWKGTTRAELDQLKNKHNPDFLVWVKEGVPFVPSMFCAWVGILLTTPFIF